MIRTLLAAGMLTLASPALASTFHPLQIARADGTMESFRVEYAADDAQRERGLMGRKTIPGRQGMLFIYDTPGQHVFWMKDTLVSLDMVFFSPDGRIVHIHPNAVPMDLTIIAPPGGEATCAILELAGGQAAAAGLSVGDRMVLPENGSACLLKPRQ